MKKLWIAVLASMAVCQSASALQLNLITTGSSGTVNGGFFQQISASSTGTGVINPFVRISGKDVEEGYNNSVSKVTLDNQNQGGTNFVKDIQLGIVPLVTLSGVPYYQFLLDLNESAGGNNELISLNELEVWLRPTALTAANMPGAKGDYDDLSTSGAVKSWDLDSGPDGESTIELNYILNPGSGGGDMFAYIPASALGNNPLSFVYLYSKFGTPNGSDASFEEWATLEAAPARVPDGGATVALLGLSLCGMVGARKLMGSKN